MAPARIGYRAPAAAKDQPIPDPAPLRLNGDHPSSQDLAQDRTDLAEDRTLLANERTYAAWTHTAFAALASLRSHTVHPNDSRGASVTP